MNVKVVNVVINGDFVDNYNVVVNNEILEVDFIENGNYNVSYLNEGEVSIDIIKIVNIIISL